MVLPPDAYEEGRRRARYHLQIQRDAIPEKVLTPGAHSLTGVVVQVFRGDRTIYVGDRVGFNIQVARDSDSLPCGPTIWADLDRLRSCAVVEAFLSGEPPQLALEMNQFELLSESSKRPSMTVADREFNDSLALLALGGIWRKWFGSKR